MLLVFIQIYCKQQCVGRAKERLISTFYITSAPLIAER